MRVDLNALRRELPELNQSGLDQIREMLASLGFPVDGTESLGESVVLEVDITSNRGDAMSHRGIARDLASRLGEDLDPIPLAVLEEGDPIIPIRLESVACPLYCSAVLELGPHQCTPDPIKRFLVNMGSNPKNLAPVDASNELLHRYGHPTHAFDADTLKGEVVVRWAHQGERVVTLDGVERTLTVQDLVIADDSGPIALGGVMGGEATKVTEGTRRVLLESAYFDPKVVRAMARRHNLHTDASHRFGRGADPAFARVARTCLANRLMEWAGARLVGAWSVGIEPDRHQVIELSRAHLHRVAGDDIRMADATRLLKRLGCKVESEPGRLKVVPPTWRYDLNIEEDLAEEVLRLRGYDRIPMALPPLEGPPLPLAEGYVARRACAQRLANLGFFQTVTLGFIGPEADENFAQSVDLQDNPPSGRTLGNPLGAEYSVMRPSLLPSLRQAALGNFRQGAREVRLFELAPTFSSRPGGPLETSTLAMVWGGQMGGEDYLSPTRAVQAADLVGVARDLGVQGPVSVHSLGEGLLALEIPLDRIAPTPSRIIPSYKGYSRFPMVERDLSLLVGLDMSYAELHRAMMGALPEGPLQELKCVDVFRHKSLPDGCQAWLMRFRFQASDRTLTGEEVDAWVQAALVAAEGRGARLRS